MAVKVVAPWGPVPKDDAARLRELAHVALDELGCDGRLIIQLATRDEWPRPDGRQPAGWAEPFAVFLCEDVLRWPAMDLACLVHEECAHWVSMQWGLLASSDRFRQEAFAMWSIGRSPSCAADWEPPEQLDRGDEYGLGRAVGAAAAGGIAALEALETLSEPLRGDLLALVGRLVPITDPQAFARELVRWPGHGELMAVQAIPDHLAGGAPVARRWPS